MNFLEFEGQLFRIDAIKNVSDVIKMPFDDPFTYYFQVFYGDHFVDLNYDTNEEAKEAKEKFFKFLKDVG